MVSRLSSPLTSRVPASGGRGLPSGTEFLSDWPGIAFHNGGVGIDIDEVRHHTRPFLKLDHCENVGRFDLEGGVQGAMGDFEGVELAFTTGLRPANTARMAGRARDPRIKKDVAAIIAFWDHQLSLLQPIPIGLSLRCPGGW